MASNSNPSATTFVQADPSNFRDVVQRLTGATQQQYPPQPQPPPTPAPQHSLLRLHQRRQVMRNNNTAARRAQAQARAAAPDINHDYYYHSMLQSFNSTCSTSSCSSAAFVQLSPVSPLDIMPQQQSCTSGGNVRVRNRSTGVVVSSEEEMMEERVIAEKGFYLRPATLKENEPRLLPLFPLHSPGVEDEEDEDDDDD